MGKTKNVGLRLVGLYEDSDSFREPAEFEKFGFYPSLSWNISDKTNLTYDLEYTTQELPFDRGVVFSEDFGFSPRDFFVGENVPIETEVVGHQIELQNNFSDNWSS